MLDYTIGWNLRIYKLIKNSFKIAIDSVIYIVHLFIKLYIACIYILYFSLLCNYAHILRSGYIYKNEIVVFLGNEISCLYFCATYIWTQYSWTSGEGFFLLLSIDFTTIPLNITGR